MIYRRILARARVLGPTVAIPRRVRVWRGKTGVLTVFIGLKRAENGADAQTPIGGVVKYFEKSRTGDRAGRIRSGPRKSGAPAGLGCRDGRAQYTVFIVVDIII